LSKDKLAQSLNDHRFREFHWRGTVISQSFLSIK